jgi:thioester reductase-like protein
MIFFTGFPGFLGKEIIPHLLKRDLKTKIVCLVQQRFLTQSERAVDELDQKFPDIKVKERIILETGDITVKDLGLGAAYNEYAAKIKEVYHFAAIYDLDVKREFAYKVNVTGTKNILDFCTASKALERHHYVSTCYVSGKYKGVFGEHQLIEGQSFKNNYDETKYEAEVLVKKAMLNGMPTTIYRPAIVTGDSKTGETQKYDGPYYMLDLLCKFPSFALFPTLGDGSKFRFNVVPRDFIVEAIAGLSGMADSLGKTYNLADPNPLTVNQLVECMARALHKKVQLIQLPLNPDQSKWLMEKLPFIPELVGFPANSVAYFAHPSNYDTTNATKDLAKLGIRCPNYSEYVDKIVAFYLANPTISSKAMA